METTIRAEVTMEMENILVMTNLIMITTDGIRLNGAYTP
jgi:hypothetical protein